MSRDGTSRWWGPVFDAERTTRARRWQGYAARSLFVLGLLGGLWLVWVNQAETTGPVTVQAMAATGSAAFTTLTLVELMAVLLVAPAATAGAICLDKTRGTLFHVFVTDLTDREIVLGKLAARLFPVWGLLACALPVMALSTWLGGIDPEALLGAFLIAAGVAGLGCSFALLLSVWAGKAQEVLAVVFGVWVVWLLACPIYQLCSLFGGRPPNWLAWSNPFYLTYAPYFHPGETSLIEPALFALACSLLGAGCAAVAVRQVRVVGCRTPPAQSRKPGGLIRRLGASPVRWPSLVRWGPKLDRDPVLWREWHRNRASRWARLVWIAFALISSVGCGMAVVEKATQGTNRVFNELHGLFVGLATTVGLLLISTATASVLAEERTRGSLDVLLATPVSSRSIVRAKWWGAFRRVPWLVFWPALVGFVSIYADDLDRVNAASVALVPALILVQGAALVSLGLGLALATWIRRPGRATAWTVGSLVTVTVVWPIVAEFIPLTRLLWTPGVPYVYTVRNAVLEIVLADGSPFVNTILPYTTARQTWIGVAPRHQAILIVTFAWTVIYALIAWLLFELTVLTFDRCLGRAPERPTRPRVEPVAGRRSWRRFGPRPIGANGRTEAIAPHPRPVA